MNFNDLFFESMELDAHVFPTMNMRTLGHADEMQIVDILEKHFPKAHIIRNASLKKIDGTMTDVDLLLVTKKGVFVIESKNFGGWIYGYENKKNWLQTFPNRERYYFPNPMSQNKSHISAVHYALNEYKHLKCYSFIVFGNACRLKKLDTYSDNVMVIYAYYLIEALKFIYNKSDDVLSPGEVDTISKHLQETTKHMETTHKKHIHGAALPHEASSHSVHLPQATEKSVKRTASSFIKNLFKW